MYAVEIQLYKKVLIIKRKVRKCIDFSSKWVITVRLGLGPLTRGQIITVLSGAIFCFLSCHKLNIHSLIMEAQREREI